jgi:hypothetical protein
LLCRRCQRQTQATLAEQEYRQARTFYQNMIAPPEKAATGKLYGEALGIPFKEESDSYLHTEMLQGAKTFAHPQAAAPDPSG